MGALSSAIQNIHFERQNSANYVVGAAAIQGCRFEMEDAHSVVLDLPKHPGTAFFGVYDGHSGRAASLHLQEVLWKKLDDLENLTQDAISKLLIDMDTEFGRSSTSTQGSTIVFGLFTQQPIVANQKKKYNVLIGWVGDSRALACSNGKMVELTDDHKANLPGETARIEKAGGMVSNDNRVDGELAMSRAFGDWNLKTDTLPYDQMKVICVPDFMEVVLEEGDWCLISCDGLTENLSNEAIYKMTAASLEDNPDDPDVILTTVLDGAVDSGSRDNMSSILVQLRDGSALIERDARRRKTFRPGPLFRNISNRRFCQAWANNCKAVGIKDPLNYLDIRRAAYECDLKLINNADETQLISQAIERLPKELTPHEDEIKLELAPKTGKSTDTQFILTIENPEWVEETTKPGIASVLQQVLGLPIKLKGDDADGSSEETKEEDDPAGSDEPSPVFETEDNKGNPPDGIDKTSNCSADQPKTAVPVTNAPAVNSN